MRNIFAILAIIATIGCGPSAPAPAPAPVAQSAVSAPVVIPVGDSPVAPAASAATSRGTAVHPLPGGAYLVEGRGGRDYLIAPSSCSGSGCPGAAPPVPDPSITPPPAPEPEECTLGLCLFTTIASWIGAVGAYLLEGIVILGILLGAAYFFFKWLPEHRRDNRWHRRAARRRGAYRVARRRFDAADDGTSEKAMWGDRMERRWARYAGFTRTADHDVDEDTDLPPPPDLGEDEAE